MMERNRQFRPIVRAIAAWAALGAVGTAAAPGSDLGRLITPISEERGVRLIAQHGELRLEFLAPDVLRLTDARNPAPPPIPPLAENRPRDPVAFQTLDPRFTVLETEALRIEIQREPLRLKILDRDGRLILEDDPDGGVGPLDPTKSAWTGRYDAAGGVAGFGAPDAISPGSQAVVRFDALIPPAEGSSIHLAPAPFGRLGERCGLALNAVGGSQLAFPEPGQFQWTNEGPFEAIVFLCSGETDWRSRLRAVIGYPDLPPSWLFGIGFGMDRWESTHAIRALPDQMNELGLPVDWIAFAATEIDRPGWNAALGQMAPRPDHWPDLEEEIERLSSKGATPVFGMPALREDRIPLQLPAAGYTGDRDAMVVIQELAKARETLIAGADAPFDYSDPDTLGLFSLPAGMAAWTAADETLPEDNRLRETYSLEAGAALPRMRAWRWREWLESGGPARRPLVLDAQTSAWAETQNHYLAPWPIRPGSDSPSAAYIAAGRAAESGLCFWGLQLPAEFSAYPNLASFRRWQQAALFAPVLMFQAPEWGRDAAQDGPPEALEEWKRLWAVRKRLHPWLYSLAREATVNGTPICRTPEAIGAADDHAPQAATLLVGSSILLAALDPDGAEAARIALPPGDWFSLTDNRNITGGKSILAAVDPQGRGLFAYARAGSLIPFRGERSGADKAYPSFRLYPSAEGGYRHYEDAGEGTAFEQGQFAVTDFHWRYEPRNARFTIEISGPLGGHALALGARDVVLQVFSNAPPESIEVDGKLITRRRLLTGPSRLLEIEEPLPFAFGTMPVAPVWDFDGSSFVTIWLPAREGLTEIQIQLPPPLAPGRL